MSSFAAERPSGLEMPLASVHEAGVVPSNGGKNSISCPVPSPVRRLPTSVVTSCPVDRNAQP